MIPPEFRASGIDRLRAAGIHLDRRDGGLERGRVRPGSHPADPGLRDGGVRRHAFKTLLAEEYDIQINKTSRNSILLQTNINNNRSDAAQLIKVLADLARKIDRQLEEGKQLGRPSRPASSP